MKLSNSISLKDAPWEENLEESFIKICWLSSIHPVIKHVLRYYIIRELIDWHDLQIMLTIKVIKLFELTKEKHICRLFFLRRKIVNVFCMRVGVLVTFPTLKQKYLRWRSIVWFCLTVIGFSSWSVCLVTWSVVTNHLRNLSETVANESRMRKNMGGGSFSSRGVCLAINFVATRPTSCKFYYLPKASQSRDTHRELSFMS